MSAPRGGRDELPSKGFVRTDIVIVLAIWFAIYVVYDLASTSWLIKNTPIGLAGELNPIGQLLFQNGVLAALVGKVVGFIALSAAIIFVDSTYGELKWVREMVEAVLLALVGLSLLAALQNFLSIVLTLFFIR